MINLVKEQWFDKRGGAGSGWGSIKRDVGVAFFSTKITDWSNDWQIDQRWLILLILADFSLDRLIETFSNKNITKTTIIIETNC